MVGWQRTRYGGYRRTGVAQGTQSVGGTGRRSELRQLPPVLTLKWAEQLGLPDCPYLIRWRFETRWGSIRLHHWLSPDDDRAFHDHPWWFVTFVLRGGYTDSTPTGPDHLHAGSVRYRPAEHQHTVIPDRGGAWTVIITGPRIRAWGFWPTGRFVKANKWFASRGHHPCAADEG
jgi:hypothetical protein